LSHVKIHAIVLYCDYMFRGCVVSHAPYTVDKTTGPLLKFTMVLCNKIHKISIQFSIFHTSLLTYM